MNSDREAFEGCWRMNAPRVLAYARRHLGDDDAHDVVSETFLAAWRRWDEVPDPAIAWLLVTARHVVANQRRSSWRRRGLADRVASLDHVASDPDGPLEVLVARHDALVALARLTEEHREAVLLISWDGLSHDQAAQVLKLRPATFRRRLSRARAALDDLTKHPSAPPYSRMRHQMAPATLEETS